MDYSYLDIFPSQRVARQLNAEDPECKDVQKVHSEAIAYMKQMDEESIRYLKERESTTLGSSETYKSLRSQERTRNSKLTPVPLYLSLPKAANGRRHQRQAG